MDEVQGMTRDDIIRMAREAGAYCQHGDFNMGHSYEFQPDQLERFAAFVAAHTLSNIDPSRFMSYQEGFVAGAAAEREACARLCGWKTGVRPVDAAIETCAAAIRARGETK